MAYDAGIFVRHIPEERIDGKRLGRHIRHDTRSLRYLVDELPSRAINTVSWARTAPIFYQGDLGSCTGNALLGCVGTVPLYQTQFANLMNESYAVGLYEEATKLDSYPGEYPPDDTGSDGLAAAAAAKEFGLISGYTHAVSLQGLLSALQTGPVAMGANWYSSFDNPDADGVVSIGKSAYVRGGHEFEVVGVDTGARLFTAANSWGGNWGLHGFFKFSYADAERLLGEDGDVTAPLPITAPSPTPTPTPDPTPTPPAPTPTPVVDAADVALATVLKPWLAQKRYFYKNVQNASAHWLKDKGL